MKKLFKNNILKYFLIIVVFFSIIKSTNFLQNVYFVNRDSYDDRIEKNYSSCKGESVAFLYSLKSKYKLNKKVKIVDYEMNPNPAWVFFNPNDNLIYKDKLILLNYRKQENIKLLNNTLNITTFHSNGLGQLKDNLTSSLFPNYITEVGLYDDQNTLMGCARLSKVIPKSIKIPMKFFVRMDY